MTKKMKMTRLFIHEMCAPIQCVIHVYFILFYFIELLHLPERIYKQFHFSLYLHERKNPIDPGYSIKTIS